MQKKNVNILDESLEKVHGFENSGANISIDVKEIVFISFAFKTIKKELFECMQNLLDKQFQYNNTILNTQNSNIDTLNA